MPRFDVDMGNGMVAHGFVCGPRLKPCIECGQVADRACDFLVQRHPRNRTCSVGVCAKHATSLSATKDACPEHAAACLADKAAYTPVRRPREVVAVPPPRPAAHQCHAEGCTVPVPPRMLMCFRHWSMVPASIKRSVYATYRRGQEVDKRPSVEYLVNMDAAIAEVAAAERRQAVRQGRF